MLITLIINEYFKTFLVDVVKINYIFINFQVSYAVFDESDKNFFNLLASSKVFHVLRVKLKESEESKVAVPSTSVSYVFSFASSILYSEIL